MWAWLVLSNFLLQLFGFKGCPGPVLTPQPRPEPWCQAFAAKLEQEVQQADQGKGYDLVFYGDSITETWRGTDMGRPCDRCKGVPEVFQKYFGSKHRSEVLAVGGDQVAHLHWRLLNGDLYKRNPPKVAVVMIGTNDLGAASCAGQQAITDAAAGTTERLQATLALLEEAYPRTRLVLLALTPRGNWPDYRWPSIYTAGLERVNAWLEAYAKKSDDAVFVDCGPALLPYGQVEPTLEPDALHPNAAGMELLAQCLSPVVEDAFRRS